MAGEDEEYEDYSHVTDQKERRKIQNRNNIKRYRKFPNPIWSAYIKVYVLRFFLSQ
jgi:hypothetical protein